MGCSRKIVSFSCESQRSRVPNYRDYIDDSKNILAELGVEKEEEEEDDQEVGLELEKENNDYEVQMVE